MGDCTFLPVFDATPLAAIAAFKASPEVFGRLRFYLGASTIVLRKQRVVKLAKLLHSSHDTADTAGTPLP